MPHAGEFSVPPYPKDLVIPILTAQPALMLAGMVVIAKAPWNPGSGDGLYRRNNANTAWVFVG